MKKKNICVVVTARPSYSRIRSALYYLKENEKIHLQLVVAASAVLDTYGKVIKQIKEDGFAICATVYDVVEGENPLTSAKTVGLGIIELSSVFNSIQPDIVVTIADRYETISTAIAASYMNIPLVHIQGGEVTGNIDEKVRHAITKMADIHMVSTKKAKQRLISMGENPDNIYITGCPSIDIAAEVEQNYEKLKFDPLKKYAGVGNLCENRQEYVVIMNHPVTTEIGLAREHTRCLFEFAKKINKQIYWFWPNIDAGSDSVAKEIRSQREQNNPANIYFFKNMSPIDFLVFLKGATCIVGNSSVAIRECSFLGVPAINIGNRQNGRERGENVIDVEYDVNDILDAYNEIGCMDRTKKSYLYGDGNSGKKIADILADLENISIEKVFYESEE